LKKYRSYLMVLGRQEELTVGR
jgi:hypothetical protein